MTTPPGNPSDPDRPGDWRSEPPAGSSGSSSEPARSPWDQPQGYQQPGYPPPGGYQQPGSQQPGSQQPGGYPPPGDHPQSGGYQQPGQPWDQQQSYPQAPAGYGQGQYGGQYGEQKKSNGFGIAALVLGILSLIGAFFGGVGGIVLGLLAIVFGVLGLRRVKARRADNKGMAITGLITGVLGLLLGIAILVFAVFLVQTTEECLTELQQTGDQAAYDQCVQDSLTN